MTDTIRQRSRYGDERRRAKEDAELSQLAVTLAKRAPPVRNTMSLVNDDASKFAGLSQPGQLREELLALGYFLWLRQVSDERRRSCMNERTVTYRSLSSPRGSGAPVAAQIQRCFTSFFFAVVALPVSISACTTL